MEKREELFEKYMTVQGMMRAMRHKRMAEEGPRADATRGQGRVLALLKLRDGLSTREMATVMGIRVQSLNETLARMEADGIVERRQSDEDKRVMLTYLTDAGKALEAPGHALPDKLFEGFSEEELDTFGSYLDRMVRALEAELGEDAATVLEHERERRREFFETGPRGRGPRGHEGPREMDRDGHDGPRGPRERGPRHEGCEGHHDERHEDDDRPRRHGFGHGDGEGRPHARRDDDRDRDMRSRRPRHDG